MDWLDIEVSEAWNRFLVFDLMHTLGGGAKQILKFKTIMFLWLGTLTRQDGSES